MMIIRSTLCSILLYDIVVDIYSTLMTCRKYCIQYDMSSYNMLAEKKIIGHPGHDQNYCSNFANLDFVQNVRV